ncbi:unnamed protein product [Spodoptera littoralis]|uniref:Uncharacterized protein n=1 Tax=Spodoptera littoralis TaxID=7109 RepID=A0A9P0IB14_SPOLI|nr:unnamed protein product [Spodoptera littoralis]CAH1643423.1 unnamed protein product [Spodoptera littoralis]
MDFTPELSAFEGLIISLNHTNSFSRITSKGGNEEKVRSIIESMTRFLKNEKYINENGVIDTMVSKTRKFAMYIVLNSDLKSIQELAEMEGVFLVIQSIPNIPQYLMCEMLWNLCMEDFVYEIITYCYPPLAVEVAESFAENYKYSDPTKDLKKLHNLSVAIYSLICRLHCFKFDKATFSKLLVTSYETLLKCLKYFTNPPNNHLIELLTNDELYKFHGKSFKTILLLIYECFSCFTREVNSSWCNDIYRSTYKGSCFKFNPPTNKVCDCPDKDVRNCLMTCNVMLLDIFQQVVMGVSIDIFCAWSEFEDDGKSMQQVIGELCHKVRTKLLQVNGMSEHPVVDMVQQMARKPAVINDIINVTDANVIIQNIYSNSEDRASWIHALVHKEFLCQHLELINFIETNLREFDNEECVKLYRMFTNYAKSNTTNREHVIPASIKIFRRCSISDKHKLLKEHFSENQFHDTSEGEHYNNFVTEMFNKFIADTDSEFKEVLDAFLLNPKEVYTKIFVLAEENAQLTNAMLKVMDLLRDYSNYYYVTETEPCIISIIKKIIDESLDSDSKQDNIVKFLSGLKISNLLPGTKLLLLIIMPHMHKALLNKDIGKIHVQMQLLNEAYTIRELLEYRAPMLAMLSQVMEVVRWGNIKAFVPKASSTLQLTLSFQKALIETYDTVIPNDEGDWLRIRLKRKNMQPQNNFYFRKLLGGQGSNFFQAVSGMQVDKDTKRSEISIWATQILSSGTLDEWCVVWDNLTRHINDIDVLCIFHEALRMIAKAVEGTRTPATRACLFYCIQNLVYIIRYKFFKVPLTDRHVISTAFSLSKLLADTNVEDIDEIGSRLMPLFAYLVEKKNNYTTDVPSYFVDTNYAALVNRAFNGDAGQDDDDT